MKTHTKNLFTVATALMVLLMGSTAMAAFPQPDALLKVKAGACTFNLVDLKDGEAIIAAPVALHDAESGEIVTRGQTSETGQYACTLEEGRYVLAVGNVLISVVDVAEDHEYEDIKVIMPREGLLIGAEDGGGDAPDEGEEADEEEDDDIIPVILGGGAAAGAAITTGAVIEHNNDSGGGGGTPSTSTPPTTGGGGGPSPTPTPVPPPDMMPTMNPSLKLITYPTNS